MLIIEIHLDELEREKPSALSLVPRDNNESTSTVGNDLNQLSTLWEISKSWANFFLDQNLISNGF